MRKPRDGTRLRAAYDAGVQAERDRLLGELRRRLYHAGKTVPTPGVYEGLMVAEAVVLERNAEVAVPQEVTTDVITFAEAMIWGLVQRPMLYTTSLYEAERLLSHYLEIRARLLGCPVLDWHDWLVTNYPLVSGNGLSIASAVQDLWPGREHGERFTEEATRALFELEDMVPPEKTDRRVFQKHEASRKEST